MSAVRKGDQVQVIQGKFKGRTGTVLKNFPKEGKVLVEKVGLVKRHQKAKPTGGPSGIVEKATKIHVSKVALIDPKTNKPTRVRFKIEGDNKIRVGSKSGQAL